MDKDKNPEKNIMFQTRKEVSLSGHCIKEYPNGTLVFYQERLVMVDLNGKEISRMDIINFVEEIM